MEQKIGTGARLASVPGHNSMHVTVSDVRFSLKFTVI